METLGTTTTSLARATNRTTMCFAIAMPSAANDRPHLAKPYLKEIEIPMMRLSAGI